MNQGVEERTRTGVEPDAPAGQLPRPYLLFLGDTVEAGFAKTAFGLRDWAPELCVGEFALPSASISLGLPRLSPTEAYDRGARALVIGVANSGGFIAQSWLPTLVEALEAGLDIISGMHARLGQIAELRQAADRLGRRLIDIRTPPATIPIATGLKRSGKRLLTVGTDCALGKKYTALSIARAFAARGVDTDFRATGQTGIMISGGGIPMDAVVSDFAAGAAEMLSPEAGSGHWDVIEGQGSILHPAYAGVSLALLHGSQPDVFVVCHDPSRTRLLGDEDFAVPPVEEIIELTIALGRRTNPAIRCGGVSLNTSSVSDSEAAELCRAEAARLGLPVADPIRGGAAFDALIDGCLRP
ncbi:MAG TPA: DUF1611 domain-containing protein [Sphingomicrobium sp.]|jgi:uncharacterized NAD-dependent epimerase/dehydratase family protein